MSDTDQPVDQPAALPLAFEVVRGGDLSAEELAAVVVALTPAGGADDPAPGPDGRPRLSPWGQATLLEGAGFRPFVSVGDVEAYHRNLA